MPHALTEAALPGVDPDRLRRLTDAGLISLEDVVEAGAARLAELTSFDPRTCRALIRAARAAIRPLHPEVVELIPPDEPASNRLARGLSAARHIEDAASVLRKAKAHTGRRPKRESWREPHAKARRQLRKLLDHLEGLQQSVLSDGLSQAAHDHLQAALEGLAREIRPILDEPIRKRSLQRLRKAARRTRKGLVV